MVAITDESQAAPELKKRKTKNRRRPTRLDADSYIKKIIKDASGGQKKVSENGVALLARALDFFLEQLCLSAKEVMAVTKRGTLSENHMKAATACVTPRATWAGHELRVALNLFAERTMASEEEEGAGEEGCGEEGCGEEVLESA